MFRTRWATVWVLILTGVFGNAAWGQAFIENVWPPAFDRGSVTRVTLEGTEIDQPVAVWSSLSDPYLQARHVGFDPQGNPTFDIEVADNAPLGFFGLRLATIDGLSNVHLFLVDDCTSSVEQVSLSNSPSGQKVSLPIAVSGICRRTDVDRYSIDVEAGQRVTFEIVASRFGKNFDPLIIIRDRSGKLVKEADNDVGLFFDCRFEHVFEQSGTYLIEVRDARYHGSEHWSYVLRMGSFPVARVVLPSMVTRGRRTLLSFPQLGSDSASYHDTPVHSRSSFFLELRREQDDAPAWLPLSVTDLENRLETEPNGGREQATSIAVPGVMHGNLFQRGDRDWYSFDLVKGQRFDVRSETRTLGSPADLELSLYDPSGNQMLRADDNGREDAAFGFSVETSGRHHLLVRDVIEEGGPEFVYRVEFRFKKPRLDLVSEVARLTIPQGSQQPLPLVLNRTEYEGKVSLSLKGTVPSGIHLARTTADPGESGQWENALVVSEDAPTGLYTFQVLARAESESGLLETLARTHPLVDRLPTGRGPHGEPFELREDQRRLPPTLTDRISVLVTQPSPFDFELEEELVVLPRYQSAAFHIRTRRRDGFESPIQFVARGGTLDHNRLQPPRVRSRIAEATPASLNVTGQLRSGVNSELVKHRVTVTGMSHSGDRKIFLTRTFDLQIKVAFEPTIQPTRPEVLPGAKKSLQLQARRREPFSGPITVHLEQVDGLGLPKSITIPEGMPFCDLEVHVADHVKPGVYKIGLQSVARVARYEETFSGEKLEIVVLADPEAESSP